MARQLTTWRKLIQAEMNDWKDDSFDNFVAIDIGYRRWFNHNAPELDEEFDDGYGSSEGRPFTMWTHEWVYFPVVYDGAEWVGRAPRSPMLTADQNEEQLVPNRHVGGE